MTDSRYLTVREFAQKHGIGEHTVRRLEADGRLPSVRFGRAIRFAPDAADALKKQ